MMTQIDHPHVNRDPVGGGQGFFLSDDRVRRIVSGSVNLFVGGFDRNTGDSMGTFQFVAELEAGDCLFPVGVHIESGGVSYRLLAMPMAGAHICQSQASWLALIRSDESIREQFERFIRHLLTPFALDMPPSKTHVITCSDLEKESSFHFEKGVSFRPGQGILWIDLNDGFCFLNGNEEQMLLGSGAVFPLSPQIWFECQDPVSITCRTTADLTADPQAGEVMASIYRLYLRAVLVAVSFRRQRRLRRQKQRMAYEQSAVKGAREHLRRLIFQRRRVPDASLTSPSPLPLHRVIQRIAHVCGFEIVLPDPSGDLDRVHGIAQAKRLLESCNLYYRTVQLDDGWWRQEGIPAIAFRTENQMPVALHYAVGGWRCFDPVNGQECRVTHRVAAELESRAITVYAPLSSGVVSLKDVLSVTMKGLKRDFRAVLLIGLIGGVIALAPIWFTGVMFNTVIPAGDTFQLFQAGVILMSTALTGALLALSRSILMLRMKTQSSFQLQAAVWGRMFSLSSRFFSRFTAGDLAKRVMGVDAMRARMADNVSMGCMTLFFAAPNLAMMFSYSVTLTVVGLGVLLIYISLICWVGYKDYRIQRKQHHYEGELAGIGLQMLTGIAKIRMSISENRAFVWWASVLAENIRWESRSIDNMNVVAMLNAFFPPLMSGLFFLIVGTHWQGVTLNVGDYLAYTAAFSSLMAAFTGFAGVMPALVTTVVLYKRLSPILETIPEVVETRRPMGEIDGNVEIRHVTFRYLPDMPALLDNISIIAEPGELIAVVGPSGAGKSTIVRLLLGFETPETGGIFYGGIDLASVNLRDLRKQIGVVLQGGGLINGSIYENIAGASGMPMKAAWEAARMAGLDKDIAAMPMGMHTLMYAGAVSGGQQQRILIARALARNPKIVIFDEATSALDNETQSHVSDSLERLNATRIVIAHRLSTIVRADRIYVLEAGRIVQTGTFSKLIAEPGLFQQLAKRQMV